MLLTIFGVAAALTMVVSYGLEPRGPRWIAAFAAGCAATAVYGVLTGAWIFAVLESVWTVLAIKRLRAARAANPLVASKTSR
jgi:hypothetical protein